jgi:hypothetical protein
MMKKLACAVTLACAVLAHKGDASACGGCFVPPTENTVVTGHRMALSISMTQTVLWDQIAYTGNPADFSWVLPVKPGARLELAHNALFEVLDAGSNTAVQQPLVQCSGGGEYYGDGSGFGCGCSSSDESSLADGRGNFVEPPPDVQVVNQATIGPYETVTLATDVPGALNTWLEDNGYSVPPEMQPTIDAYVADGFDFIALKLAPGVGVNRMQPVRVVTQGSSFTLPLRMVAAGTGAQTAVSLFVIAEGRYEANNFANAIVDQEAVLWDFNTSSSNYSEVRLDALGANDGAVWLTSYAQPGPLFASLTDPLTTTNGQGSASPLIYAGDGWQELSLANAYVSAGSVAGALTTGNPSVCKQRFDQLPYDTGVVVDDCDDMGNCIEVAVGEIAMSDLVCGELDDIAVAMVGMHPRDVWVTRLDADLPRGALGEDLLLAAAAAQDPIAHRFVAGYDEEAVCGTSATAALLGPATPPRKIPGGLVALLLGGLGALYLVRRKSAIIGAR